MTLLKPDDIRHKLGNTSKILQADDYKILKLVLKYSEEIEELEEGNKTLTEGIKANFELQNKIQDDLDFVNKELEESKKTIAELETLAWNGAVTDGGHHKQHYLEEILKILDPKNKLGLEFEGIAP